MSKREPDPRANGREFVSEELTPMPGTADASAAARGEPGLPARFTWRGQTFAVMGVERSWKTSGPCHHGSGEMYLRRHWRRIVAQAEGAESPVAMTVYCERQARSRSRAKSRWFVYTVEAGSA